MLMAWKERMCWCCSSVCDSKNRILSKTFYGESWARWEYLTLRHFMLWHRSCRGIYSIWLWQCCLVRLRKRITFFEQMWLTSGVSGGRLSFKLNLSSWFRRNTCLKFCSSAVSKPWTHSEETLFDPRLSAWSSEPEECMIFYCAFPKIFTTFFTGQSGSMNQWSLLVHDTLHDEDYIHLKMKTCSCSEPSSSSSTTIRVSFFFWKSSFIILGQKNRPIFWLPSYTKIPK